MSEIFTLHNGGTCWIDRGEVCAISTVVWMQDEDCVQVTLKSGAGLTVQGTFEDVLARLVP